jgi:ATP/maltotriose-dependent transcriptional regulator MalT
MNAELQHLLLRDERQRHNAECKRKESEQEEPAKVYSKWGLTQRESEILYYLGQGCSNADIAGRLFVSENTIKFHVKNIYLKLDVKNRIQAMLRCNGLNKP